MPTYEYECEKCRHAFEYFQNITESPIEVCPKCKGKVRRLISAGAGFIFKGSGFYATDYKKTKKPKNPSCPLSKQNEGYKTCPQNNDKK